MTDKDRTPVARDAATLCPRCGLELRHVVISHTAGGIVAKVKCYTCGSEHKYHPVRKPPVKREQIRSVRVSPRKAASTESYARLLELNRHKEIVIYNMAKGYNVHDVIEHKTFGKGVILEIYPQKIEVRFESDTKILACNRQPGQ
jgi:hypothetical protein